MKKIRILTFHRAINNGAVLQAFALSKALLNMNVDAKYIDYTAAKIKRDYFITPLLKRKTLKSVGVFFLVDLNIKASKRKFSHFVENYIPMEYFGEPIDENKLVDIDVLMSGGDQIWNVSLTDNDLTYFLNFSDRHLKASYGTSFGKNEFSEEEKVIISSKLRDYKYLYVREYDGKKIIDDISGMESSVVPDPVFLLSKNEWIEMFNFANNNINKDYVLFFELHDNEEMREFARKVANENKCKIYRITNDFFTIKGMKNIKRTGPIDFLRYIYYAKYVVTDSFHAACFSLIFNKELFIGLKKGEFSGLNTRIVNLANCYGISNRIIDSSVTFSNIDYAQVNKKIEEQSNIGFNALRTIIGE